MKIKLLNGKDGKIETRPSRYPIKSQNGCRSKIQYEIGQLISERFPADPILEDVPVPGEGFYLDFFLPKKMVAFEIQGAQHDKFIPFFHKTKRKFVEAQARDSRKLEFCRINDITLYTVRSPQEVIEILDNVII
jgi:hypothetical protein